MRIFLIVLASLLSFTSIAGQSVDSESRTLTLNEKLRIRRNDYALALVPGAVQLRKDHPAIAGVVWGTMAITGGLAVYKQICITRLQHRMASDASNADWYDGKIRNAEKIRNGSLYALGGIYIASYISAILLPDKNNKTKIALYAVPQEAVGLTYALNF